MADTVSILDGNTFAVSDRRGDMALEHGTDSGLFRADTRFLSRWVLTVDGQHPNVLSIDDNQYFRTQFFMTLSTGTIYVNSHISVIRRRSIGNGFVEELEIINHGKDPSDMKVVIEADSDFADLFEVKDQLPKKGELYREIDRDRLVLGYRRDRFVRETWISSTEPARLGEKGLEYDLHLPAHSNWTTTLRISTVVPTPRGAAAGTQSTDDRRSDLEHDSLAWVADAPRLTTSWDPLRLTYQ